MISTFLDSGAPSLYNKFFKTSSKKGMGSSLADRQYDNFNFIKSNFYKEFFQNYIDFIKEHNDCLPIYANFDVINNAEETLKNQLEMERQGLHPIPVFHFGTDLKYLQNYLDKGYSYIALGGMVPNAPSVLQDALDNIWKSFFLDANNYPKVKVHGFAMTSFQLMFRYPWYSVDSSSWALTGAFGSIIVPKLVNLKPNYLVAPLKIKISNRAPKFTEEAVHFDTMSPMEQKALMDFVESRGFKLGKSSHKKVDKSYKLTKNERWVKINEEVETIHEYGVSNDHNQRDRWNIQYFVDVEKAIPTWPWAFKPNKLEGFGL
jgi:hypothetical protein